MYPLNVISVGCEDTLLPHVRRELTSVSAHVEAEYPALGQAAAALRSAPGPKRLLVVHLRSLGDAELLGRLSHGLFGWPIVALLDPGSGPEMTLAAVRAGASQVVPLPLQAADFKAALDHIVRQFVRPTRGSRIVAVAGATGGCGTTTIALNLAYEFAQTHGLHVILADLSLKMGVVASYLGIDPKYTVLELLRDISRVDSLLLQNVLAKVTDNLFLLPGPHAAIHLAEPRAADVMHVVNTAALLADVVVLDLPATYDELYFEALAGAGHAVLVCEQKIPSVRALKMVHEALGRDASDGSVGLVINRYDPKIQGFEADRLARLLGARVLYTIAQDSQAVLAATNRGCPLRLESPRSPTLADIDALAAAIVGDAPEEPAARPGLLGRLRRTFSKTR